MRLGGTSPDAPRFRGFMVDVRKSENVPAMGSFVEFGPGSTGLKCNGIQVSCYYQLTIKSSLLKKIMSTCIGHIITAVTLYRPGLNFCLT